MSGVLLPKNCWKKAHVCVIINSHKQEDLDKVVEELGNPDNLVSITADLSHKEGIDDLIAKVKKIGDLYLLVNNAGRYSHIDFEDSTDEDWLKHFEFNIVGGVRITRAFFPEMFERNTGRVIYISSADAVRPWFRALHYSSTKATQLNIARGLSQLTKGTNVTVNSILMGPTMTDGAKVLFEKGGLTTDEKIKEQLFDPGGDFSSSLVQRMLSPEEIAVLVPVLASPRFSAINGAALRAEGGLVQSVI